MKAVKPPHPACGHLLPRSRRRRDGSVAGTNAKIAKQIVLLGRVQGLGIRPAIAKLAIRLKLNGTVTNTSEGVKIHLEGLASEIARFQALLANEMPPMADFHVGQIIDAHVAGCQEFRIVAGLNSRMATAVDVPTDLAMCAECARELADPSDRRFGYAFSSCTQCGPRYSIIRLMPYERRDTSMARFCLCSCCEAEFRHSEDRRFHAQTVACSDCGPQLWFEAENTPNHVAGMDAIAAAADILRAGGILAMKGIGGYQLICDATNETAVQRLRGRKRRYSKPLAVMISASKLVEQRSTSPFSPVSGEKVADRPDERAVDVHNLLEWPPHPGPLPQFVCDDVADHGRVKDANKMGERGLIGATQLSIAEFEALTSPANAIVILDNVGLPSLASSVSPGINSLGVLLPTTPLHALLLNEVKSPIVVTSGNQDSDPLAFEESAARLSLREVADGWLHHDRPIERPVDDSVVRIIAGKAVTIRAARGIAPLRLPLQTRHVILAVGGEQKVACAFSNGRQVVLGPHLGDMSSLEVRRRFVEYTKSLQQLYGAEPSVIAHDLHPDYFTTRWAADQGLRTFGVQHHHAHIVSGMLQHGLLDQEVLGVAFDGTGYGADGTIWGGEFLLAKKTEFRRVASLTPYVLPGGDAAIREPWRVAVSLLTAAIPEITAEQTAEVLNQNGKPTLIQIRQVQRLVNSGIGPLTSSMGRLFDGVASIVLGIGTSGFEGEPAMRLEAACDATDVDLSRPRAFCTLESAQAGLRVDWRPIVRQVVTDLRSGQSASLVATRFHRAIASAVGMVAEKFPSFPVVLSGGCFQNRILTELVVAELEQQSRTVASPGTIPPNDGGLAAGQIAIAAAQLEAEQQLENSACA